MNPVVTANAPDPSVISAGGIFYAYTTQSTHGQDLIHVPILASRDLVDWYFVGDALKDLPKWADTSSHSDTWAPDIVRINGHYNIYLAERLKATGSMGIAVASSDSPKGPFHVAGEPLMEAPGFIDIDPFVFKDSDGRLLMYWGSNGVPIRVQQLSKDGTRRMGAPRPVLSPSSATSYDSLVEGPSVVHHNGFYFLFYSGNLCCGANAHYAVLVARSRSPLGPFERAPTNPIIAANAHFTAPGHGTVFRDASGAYFILYHAMLASDPTYVRELMLDRIRWRGGWPVVNGGDGPEYLRQPRPQVGT
jgi:arabinan endo-1,5-alpha-L-arabinosidase